MKLHPVLLLIDKHYSGCSGQARQRSELTFGDLANTYVSTVLKAGYRYERIDIVVDRYQEETVKAANKKTAHKIHSAYETTYILREVICLFHKMSEHADNSC